MESYLNHRLDTLEVGGGNAEEGARVIDEVKKLREALAAEKERSAMLNRLLMNESFENDRLRRKLNKA